MFFVDTNIFLYAVDAASAQYRAANELVKEWRSGRTPWHTSWNVIFEFLRVTTHHRVFPKPLALKQAWQFMQAILASPTLKILVQAEKHQEILNHLIAEHSHLKGNILHDFHNATLMVENGIRKIYTCDTDFHRFKFLDVINPL